MRKALARRTIVPPRVCDHCYVASSQLWPYHPDPKRPREIAWLCANDRRSVPALGGELYLGWRWPGVAGPPPPPRLGPITIDPAWVDAANAAALAIAPANKMHTPDTVRRWAATLFAAGPPNLADRVYALAPRGRLRHLDAYVRGLLEWWARIERTERNREAHRRRDDVGTTVTVTPRPKQKAAQAEFDVPTIGAVALPPQGPPTRIRTLGSVAEPSPSEDEILARADAAIAAVDQLLARFSQSATRPAPRAPRDDADSNR